MPNHPIRVLIVDDSAVVRKLVSDALRNDPDILVVGTAADPYAARDKIKELSPDVLTLDLEMPRMDGLTFLRIVMEQHPLPVIVMSSLTQRGSAYAMEALQLGAFDVLGKPSNVAALADLAPQLIARIKATTNARIRRGRPYAPKQAKAITRRPFNRVAHPRELILLGSSTGGTEALREILTQLPAGLPGIAIVQHIPPVFSKSFADRLSQETAFEVREAVDGDRLVPGIALIAPGDFHMMLQWNLDHYAVKIVGGPAIWYQRPAVDILFKSAAECGAAPHTLAAILTGMGKDGAEGLLGLRRRGATTLAQDEATSAVYGMPRVAWENGGAQSQVPLDRIAEYIVQHCETGAGGAAARVASATVR